MSHNVVLQTIKIYCFMDISRGVFEFLNTVGEVFLQNLEGLGIDRKGRTGHCCLRFGREGIFYDGSISKRYNGFSAQRSLQSLERKI